MIIFLPLLLLLASTAQGCVEHGSSSFTIPRSPLLHRPRPSPSAAEATLLSAMSNATARMHLRRYTRTPHMAGSVEDLELARYTLRRFESFGLRYSRIEEVTAMLAEPKGWRDGSGVASARVEIKDAKDGAVLFRAALAEKTISRDPSSDNAARNGTVFLGYAPSGTAQGRLVYANFGRPEDFEELERRGVSVKGMVVIVRYGMCFRGLKVMNAQERGAIAVLIYSDPAEDGYAIGEVYPDGPWRPSTSVQRGSVQFNSKCSGDPGRKGVEELCGYKTEDLHPRIPAVPLSYDDALPLLRILKGPLAPEGFIGALAIEYRLGPSPANRVVNVTTNNEFFRAPIWNVISVIHGEHYGTDQDRPVILGNHRDAWVYGAADPHSGSVVLLEVARGFGKLLQTGWKPKRTIILCSWSGEELGLIGSTAFGEAYENGILKNALVYLNVDVAVSGPVPKFSATPSLGDVIRSALDTVPDPFTGKPLSSLWDHELVTLGSGSDYSVFLDHLGIASADIRFTSLKDRNYGTYHSIYDSFSWMAIHVDPTFERHQALARVMGLIALRIADAMPDQLPFNLTLQAQAIAQYVKGVEDLLHDDPAIMRDRSVMETLEALHDAVRQYMKLSTDIPKVGSISFNDRVGLAERLFLDKKEGLPRRKWFRHLLQAPGFYLGYDAEALPGIIQEIREPANDARPSRIVHEMTKVIHALERVCQYISPLQVQVASS